MNTNLLIALLLGYDFNEEGCSLRSKNLKVKLKKYEDYKMFDYNKNTLQIMLELEKSQDVVFEFRKINSHYQMIKIHNLYYSHRDVSKIVGTSLSEMFKKAVEFAFEGHKDVSMAIIQESYPHHYHGIKNAANEL